MAIKKGDIYRSLWDSCDQLRGGMAASLNKEYILTLLFLKYVSDRAGQTDALIEVPEGCSFSDMRKLRGTGADFRPGDHRVRPAELEGRRRDPGSVPGGSEQAVVDRTPMRNSIPASHAWRSFLSR